jgi:hypothetical protein
MASNQHLNRSDQNPGAPALEAVRLGERLDANHPADPGGLQSIGTCRKCGYLIFESHGRGWKHLPSVEEREKAGKWLTMHEPAP